LCAVARTAQEQAQGLQERQPLGYGEGMLFPFMPTRAATFHMGRVSYPIDIVFVGADRRIARIVHMAQPGTRTRWSHPACSAVVELLGAMSVRANLQVGDVVTVPAGRTAGHSYNLLRTLTEAEAEPLMEGYYSKEPLETRTPPDSRSEEERFKDRKLPPDSFPEAMDQPAAGWEQTIGYQPTENLDEIGPNVRMSAVEDPGQFIASIIEAMTRASMARGEPVLAWQPDLTNAGATENAMIRPQDVAEWIEMLELSPMGRQDVIDELESEKGLELLGDGFILSGIADLAKVQEGVLILFRGREE
jgi:hypothetical protein